MFFSIKLLYGISFRAEIVKERGIENVTVDNLIAEITPKARGKEIVTLNSTS